MARARRPPGERRPERTAEPVAQWLRAPPGGEGLARERSSPSAEGARPGASEAIQGAARCHGVPPLRATLDEVFPTPPHALEAVKAAARQPPVPLPDGPRAVPVPPPPPPARAEQQAAPRAAQRQARSEQVWA